MRVSSLLIFVSLAAAAAFSLSCGSGEKQAWSLVAGKDFDINRVSVIQKGSTSKNDIIQLFGYPYKMKGDRESEEWEYFVKFGREYVTITYLIVPTRKKETIVRRFTVKFDGDYVKEFETKVDEY